MKHARRDYDRIQDPSGKIPADEPVFLVRAQDMSAPATLRFWAAENQKNGGDEDLTALVDDWAIRMEEWQQQHGKKPADLGPMAASTAQPAAPTGFDAEFLSQRLARVAKLAGVPMPDMTHEQIAEAAGTILGQIAANLEKVQKQLSDSIMQTVLAATAPDVRKPAPTILWQSILRLLNGIDECETSHSEGWWETSVGAEFGAKKLAELETLINNERTYIFPEYGAAFGVLESMFQRQDAEEELRRCRVYFEATSAQAEVEKQRDIYLDRTLPSPATLNSMESDT